MTLEQKILLNRACGFFRIVPFFPFYEFLRCLECHLSCMVLPYGNKVEECLFPGISKCSF